MSTLKSFILAILACSALAELVPEDYTDIFDGYTKRLDDLWTTLAKELGLYCVQEATEATKSKIDKYIKRESVQVLARFWDVLFEFQDSVDQADAAQAVCMKNTLGSLRTIQGAVNADIMEIDEDLAELLNTGLDNCIYSDCLIEIREIELQLENVEVTILQASRDVMELVTAEVKSCVAENCSMFREKLKQLDADFIDSTITT